MGMAANLLKARATTVSFVRTTRGTVRERAVHGSSPTEAAVEDMFARLGELAPVFPAEPIGPGAKWEFFRDAVVAGGPLRDVVACELVERAGNRVVVKVSLVQGTTPHPRRRQGRLPPRQDVR